MKLNKQKKGGIGDLLATFMGIAIFGLISVVLITVVYLWYAVGHDYIVLPMYDVSQQGGFVNDTQFQTAYETTVTNYQDIDINNLVDDTWLFGYFIVIILSMYLAYRSKTTNIFSWVSMLTYGLMIVLFVVGLFGVIISWWYDQLLLNLFDNLAVNPIAFAYYVRNFSQLFLFQAAAMLLVNIVDFDFSTIFNRKKKEAQALDDEIV